MRGIVARGAVPVVAWAVILGAAPRFEGMRKETSAGRATVAVVGLRPTAGGASPADVSGSVYVLLEVRQGAEDVVAAELTLGAERLSCTPDGPLVASGPGGVLDCLLDTRSVREATCEGMPLEPRFPNGEYEVGAVLTTASGEKRKASATLKIRLNNHNFIMLAHGPGRSALSEAGIEFHGGPADAGNVNSFHACPVAFDGSVVGSLRLVARLMTAGPDPVPVEDGPAVTYRREEDGPAYPVDDEPPFTWSVSTAEWSGNRNVENRPGVDAHWIANEGPILDPNGLDVSTAFRADGEPATLGPIHFDFVPPRLTGGTGIHIGGAPLRAGAFYSDGPESDPTKIEVPGYTDDGVGGVHSRFTVRVCDGSPQPAGGRSEWHDVELIRALPEGACYRISLRSVGDALGNGALLPEDEDSS